MRQVKCKKCSGNKFWSVRRGKLRCKKCLYEYKPKIGNVNLSRHQWKKLPHWFLRCQSANVVSEETGISKYKILKSLRLVREIMIRDILDIFDGTVEVDETYLGYLKRQLVSRGGIRAERLPLYLAEYVWRYNNNRELPVEKQINTIKFSG